MKTTNFVIYCILVAFSGYIFADVLLSRIPLWLKIPVLISLIAVFVVIIDKVYTDYDVPGPVKWLQRIIQQAATRLGIITIVSLYNSTGRYTVHSSRTLIQSKVFFFWIPRTAVLSEKAKMVLDYVELGIEVKAVEERYIGQYAK